MTPRYSVLESDRRDATPEERLSWARAHRYGPLPADHGTWLAQMDDVAAKLGLANPWRTNRPAKAENLPAERDSWERTHGTPENSEGWSMRL